MEKKKRDKFMEMIHEEIGEDHKLSPIIASLLGMVEDDERFEELYDIHEGIEEYGQFLTEKEARQVTERMVAFDGMRGPKWQPHILFDVVPKLGGAKAVEGEYNCWALYTLMNAMHSDYGEAIMEVAKGDDYPLTCYRMALAWMNDRDHDNNVREYFLE